MSLVVVSMERLVQENCGVMTVVSDVNFAIRFVEIAKIFGTDLRRYLVNLRSSEVKSLDFRMF
jgi:hypothetical protein